MGEVEENWSSWWKSKNEVKWISVNLILKLMKIYQSRDKRSNGSVKN